MSDRLWRHLLGAALLLLSLLVSSADAQRVDASQYQLVIATSDDSATTGNIVAELRRMFPTARIASATNVRQSQLIHPVYVAVGPAALRTLLSQHLDAPIISVFTSSQAYREILLGAGGFAPAAVTAIYPEPSPVEQLRLIAAIYRKPVSVAVLASTKSAHLLPMLKENASQLRIELKVEMVEPQDNINRLLNRVANTPVLLALPDPTIYTPENIRNILITTYRRNQAVVGFSAAFVKAGALASNVSNTRDILAQLQELLDDFAASGRLADAQFPRYFDVVLNAGVARSLNLVIDEAIKQRSRKPAGRAQP